MTTEIQIRKHQFLADIDTEENTTVIKSVHPYDFSEYCWAKSIDDGQTYNIYFNGKQIAKIDMEQIDLSKLSLQEAEKACHRELKKVCLELLRLDKQMGIKAKILND